MAIVLIDAKFYGNAIRMGRRSARMGRGDMAKILNIPRRTLARIEHGKILPSNELIHKIFAEACNMLWAKNYRKIKK
ncbi:MAG: helix-turn-helix transcriptional regulator [Alphaproteobacteria bacterium]|nr:helix-turn-helix transcriptional regulator [Alphaproteobacteria bacterium]